MCGVGPCPNVAASGGRESANFMHRTSEVNGPTAPQYKIVSNQLIERDDRVGLPLFHTRIQLVQPPYYSTQLNPIRNGKTKITETASNFRFGPSQAYFGLSP
ncbi:hypothetical protein TorRG33x02_279150 [Trema orientale]|uniref:Uncharacterized protein n=1 Tax=Trema orientale TaxID=63057 RepID=A0A2P5CMZ1_TREOI|nr:hypothetical protein TorRG33x02_279150 [Trema orientale]